jgi:hypothetical protein
MSDCEAPYLRALLRTPSWGICWTGLHTTNGKPSRNGAKIMVECIPSPRPHDLKIPQGPVIYVHVARMHIVVVNTYAMATSMLQQKAGIYSDRPKLHFLSNLIGWKNSATLLDDGPQLKDSRRLFSQEIGTKVALERFTALMEVQSCQLVERILDDLNPAQLRNHIQMQVITFDCSLIKLTNPQVYHGRDLRCNLWLSCFWSSR